MPERRSDLVPRETEATAVSALLIRASTETAGLLVEGEAGIGKTTLWLAACAEASARGFRVLSARGDPSEVRLAFAALADLLADVDQSVIDDLPPVQRDALNRILLRGNAIPATDERAAASAFQAVVHELASHAPVLLAIDDVQWLDSSSAAAVRFAARRLSGAVGLLISARTAESPTTDVGSSFALPHPDAVTRIRMSGLTLGGLHALMSSRLGGVLPRPVMTRIHELSGGNPFYALELARAASAGARLDHQLPNTLAKLVRARVQAVDAETGALLLTAASTPAPTVEVVARATATSAPRVVQLLEHGETAQIVDVIGNRIRFLHPLLATGVYAGATAARRRDTHRRLAQCVDIPELRARHLASAAVTGDPATLDALDTAAEITRGQGAPAAAAELLDLAINLGGDTPLRRIRGAEHHFRAGSLDVARRLLQPAVDVCAGDLRCHALMLLAAIHGYSDDTAAAVDALTRAAHAAGDDTALQLHCVLRVVFATVMVDRIADAVDHAKTAVALADRLGAPELRSRALSIWVVASFIHGLGVDEAALRDAVDAQDALGDATTWYRASAVQAMIAAWTGDLHTAREQMLAERRRMLDRGAEVDVIWADNHLTTIDVWLGRYDDAADSSSAAVERAEQMGGRALLITTWGWQAAIAAYTGRETDARRAATAAISAAREIGAPYLAHAPSATLVFLEVSLGNHAAAMTLLEPLLATFDPSHHTEIVVGGHLPDAIETLTVLNRVEEAERLTDALHDNGTRLHRTWMLAMAARGRAHCLAARSDLSGAEHAAVEAMEHHQGLPMPFERARTQLLLGQLQRRRRQRTAAAASVKEALTVFDDIGTPWWSQRARTELARISGASERRRSVLTAAERRIAERAAAGLSNKEIAAEQFLAVKTVEMTLSNVYRKLDIRSRAQLHERLDRADARDIPGSQVPGSP